MPRQRSSQETLALPTGYLDGPLLKDLLGTADLVTGGGENLKYPPVCVEGICDEGLLSTDASGTNCACWKAAPLLHGLTLLVMGPKHATTGLTCLWNLNEA
mmetsp:Transcript_116101/g.211213  ORF Transcript_116101/g.211213 Transcript_116101/m.211213 type:complete len:101 (-) Transcript_116101:949-1251(-)